MLKATKSALDAIEKFHLPKENLKFGQVISPVMTKCLYQDGKWHEPKLVPYGPITMMPTAKVLHYGQEIFEGMKAYRVDGKGPFLFRAEENWKRFNHSARRMAMPEVPAEIFMESVKSVTSYSADFIPTQSGQSLYLRPFMFTIEESLGIKPSEEFLFMVIASPSGAYFSGGSVKVWIERDSVRACPGGTGTAKTGGNYAASLKSAMEAKAKGFDQTLWLDAVHRENIEEMSGMNFFCVVNGKLTTPALTDTILEGITRKSLIELAKTLNIEVSEETIKINELLSKIESGECSEAFACGTAVIITPIESMHDGDKTYKLENTFGPIAKKLRNQLLDIQEGRLEGPSGWVEKIETYK